MLRRLGPIPRPRPGTVAIVWVLVAVLGIAAAGALFSSLEADLDDPASFESEQVRRRLHELGPRGAEIAAVIEGAPVPETTMAALAATPGVRNVVSGPSDDGLATGGVVDLEPDLDDSAEDDAAPAVDELLRGGGAPP